MAASHCNRNERRWSLRTVWGRNSIICMLLTLLPRRVHENTPISQLLAGHLALQPGAAAKHHALQEYREAGQECLTVLLRKERTPVRVAGLLWLAGGRLAICMWMRFAAPCCDQTSLPLVETILLFHCNPHCSPGQRTRIL